MDILKQRIIEDVRILDGEIIKVDSFLNHQVDIKLINQMGEEFKNRFKDVRIDKILTAEVSGIAIASIVAQYFDVPMVFARKTESKNLDEDKYVSEVYSYTKRKNYKIMVSKRYMKKNENVLIIDDFLANGKAVEGLIEIIDKARANLVGVGVAIEKGFQEGGKGLRDRDIKLESLAIIESIEKGKVEFR